MVEVDPRLFVTCRLCLDVEGQYQIVPTVQEQIKYCFDIDVEPFDRLPQLICRKCEQILSQYHVIKKNFIEKQKELKAKVENNVKRVAKLSSPQQSESDSAPVIHNIIAKKKKQKTKRIKKRKIIGRFMSSSCDELDQDESSISTSQQNQKCTVCNDDSVSWEKNLYQYFVCRICSQKFQGKEGIKKHLSEHSYLKMKYKSIFNISCLVVMEKIDGKPNVTNNNKTVVYSADSYIQNEHNPYYYIMYHPKNNKCSPKRAIIQSNMNEKNNSTDIENILHKRRRIMSRSSSETVVINRDVSQVIDFIDIDDSSDNASCDSNGKNQTSSIDYKNEDTIDTKSINNIIRVCQNRYAKKLSGRKRVANNIPKDSFLQHKVLSIGRKIINNKTFNCTGLLRFLEYKDLKVIWKEISVLNTTTDGKYVRIASRIRGNDSNKTTNEGWKNVSEFVQDDAEPTHRASILKKLKSLNNFKDVQKCEKSKSFINEDTDAVEHLPRISSVFSHSDLEISKTVDHDSQQQKLLNTSPVLNPKQLPKSKNSNESSSIIISKLFTNVNSTVSCFDAKRIDRNHESNSNTMPIIKSAESLAPQLKKQEETRSGQNERYVNSSLNNNPQKLYPRIKVKPVSELMPETTISSINTNQGGIYNNGNQNVSSCNKGVRTIDNISNNCQELYTPTTISNYVCSNINLPSSEVTASKSSNTTDTGKEYIIMDTVEFPNEKTDSPFEYLKKLLLVYNITLLDTDTPLSSDAICLLKLKFLYQQEKCQPITLSWSLFCCKSTFYIKIRDMQQRDIHLGKLSAHWQWQLLKIYNNDIVNKVLETARRVNNETYDYTNNFFTLLKSINSRTI